MQPPTRRRRAVRVRPRRFAIREIEAGVPTYKKKTELSTAFNVSYTTVEKWCRRADFPGGRKGPWDHGKVKQYLAATKSPVVAPRGRNGQDDSAAGTQRATAAARALKLREEHRRLKLQNDLLEGQLVYRHVVERNAAELVLRIKTELEQLPNEIEFLMPVESRIELKAEIADIIHRQLLRMANWEPLNDD